MQWGGAHVWKVGGKVFAIGGWSRGEVLARHLQMSPISPMTSCSEQPGLRPAPYLASRGMKWIQRAPRESMDDDALKDYLRESRRLVALKLPKKQRQRTRAFAGLNAGPEPARSNQSPASAFCDREADGHFHARFMVDHAAWRDGVVIHRRMRTAVANERRGS